MPCFGHETGIEQDAQVLRDGRAAHLEMSRNRVDRAVGFDEQIEHPPPRGMADRSKNIGLVICSRHHAANIRKQILTCQVRAELFLLERSAERIGPEKSSAAAVQIAARRPVSITARSLPTARL